MGAATIVGYLLHGPLPDDEPGGAVPTVLYDALGAHSPTVEPDPPDGCWLDLRAGGRRGPRLPARAAAILATAREWGCPDPRFGAAPTPGVARLAARHGAASPTLLDGDGVAAFLAPLSLADLDLGEALAGRLALVGLRTLGDLARLPRGALGEYAGADGPPLEALARGEDDRPLVPARPPLVLEARRELDFALVDRAALARLIERLLTPLLAALRRQGLGATRATLTLTGAGGGAQRRRVVTARLGRPTVAASAVLAPLLAALPESGADADGEAEAGGVTAVAVAVAAPRPLVGRQASFFDVPQGRRGLLRQGVAEVGRRAEGRVGHLAAVDPRHPLPERRYALVPLATPNGDGPEGA